MSASVVTAVATIEFWFGVAVGVAFDETARGALKRLVFDDKEEKGDS